MGLAGGTNLYGFGGGDAVNYSDPFGLCPVPTVCPVRPGGLAGAALNGIGQEVNEWWDGTVDRLKCWQCSVLAVLGSMMVDGIDSPDESPALGSLHTATMRAEFDGVVRPAFWRAQARNNSASYSESNVSRMVKGKAPIGADGYPMELHHKIPLAKGGSNAFDNLEIKTRTDHRLGENFKKNHPDLPED